MSSVLCCYTFAAWRIESRPACRAVGGFNSLTHRIADEFFLFLSFDDLQAELAQAGWGTVLVVDDAVVVDFLEILLSFTPFGKIYYIASVQAQMASKYNNKYMWLKIWGCCSVYREFGV